MSNVVTQNNAIRSTNNERTSPLLANETWESAGDNCLEYPIINVALKADVDSASRGLKFQFSGDGENWTTTDDFDYITNGYALYSIPRVNEYFR